MELKGKRTILIECYSFIDAIATEQVDRGTMGWAGWIGRDERGRIDGER